MTKTRIITLATILIYVVVLIAWQLYDPTTHFTQFVPGADHRPAGTARRADDVVIGEYFMRYESAAPTSPETSSHDSWTGFRGTDKNNITTSAVQLVEGQFSLMWTQETGEGHAAPIIADGRVYLLDYDEKVSSDALRCFDLQTGEELWRRWYRVPMKRNHGFSRTVPAIYDHRVVTIGPEGHVMCCDAQTGDLLWTIDMKQRYGTEIPFWYTGQCPYITPQGELIIAPAGKDVLLAGVDMKSGEEVWTTPNTVGFKMSHSSVMPMVLSGQSTLVYAGVGGVCGVAADGGDKGKLLWSANKWQPSVIAPSPLQLSSNQIFLVAGYGAGGALLQVDRSGGSWTATIREQYKADKGLSSEQQTPILYNGMIITILPKDGGGMRERISLFAPSDLHHAVWNSAADERFGLGPYMIVDGKLFALKETGELYVYDIQPRSLRLIRSQPIIADASDAWGPMAYADGMLLVRDAKRVCCVKIKAEG